MGWETRKGSRNRYYTRTHKANGRYWREYVGTGEKARRASIEDSMRREAAQDRCTQLAETRARYAQADEALQFYYQAVDAAMRETLEAAGYHRHDRGHWRLRRGYSGIASGL